MHDALRVIKELEQFPWEIGDAVLAECGPPAEGGVGDDTKMDEVLAELKRLNIEGYSRHRLTKLWRTAHSFPPDKRRPGVSWEAHAAAGSPEMLEKIVQRARG